jgi:hypothetical protein
MKSKDNSIKTEFITYLNGFSAKTNSSVLIMYSSQQLLEKVFK